MLLEFSRNISEQKTNFIKIRPVEAEMFYADRQMVGQTGITKLIVALRNFAKAPKNVYSLPVEVLYIPLNDRGYYMYHFLEH